MINKIIKKEKERQKLFLTMKMTPITTINCHKQSLINLKEYMEEEIKFLMKLEGNGIFESSIIQENIDETKTDIKELIKMIKRYK